MPHTLDDLNRRQRHRLAVNARWLLRWRWVAAFGQLVTILGARFGLGVALPVGPLLSIVGFTLATNAVLWFAWKRQIQTKCGPLFESQGEGWLAAVMGVDMIALSALLSLTGGFSNPFAVFYFVNLSLSAVLLPPRSHWLLTAVAVAAMCAVFNFHRTLPGWGPGPGESNPLGQLSLLLAFCGCACVVVYFIRRVVNELKQRESELRLAEKNRAAGERLESLATLAAGAGHELASPLSTIAVIANDLSRHLEGAEVRQSVRDDVLLIRQELDHCRSILHRMSSHAGHELAEEIAEVEIGDVVEQVMSGVRTRDLVSVELSESVSALMIRAPLEGLAQAIRGLVQNALDASLPEGSVRWSNSASAGYVQMVIRDQGDGMDPATLARAGEPFFTTKEPGKGMGLGLFLARNVIERFDGTLRLSSTPTKGTTVEIRIPLQSTRFETP